MKIHLIAIGGAIMHNLAMELHDNGHDVTGSDDAIYDPARSRLAAKGILPKADGWFPSRISSDLELVILGMHARIDNIELKRAQELGLTIMSFPEFMYDYAKDKLRVVIAGSHGKTTTTSMVLHLLKSAGKNVDYLVGAQLEGFDNMVRLSDAPIAVFEGDEYSASPLDLRPKFIHYKPHITVITGIAWDHINIFDTHEKYMDQFDLLMADTHRRGTIFYYQEDADLNNLAVKYPGKTYGYQAMAYEENEAGAMLLWKKQSHEVRFFGRHNFENLQAAYLVVKELGLSDEDFIKGITTFPGPARRLEVIHRSESSTIYYDFAHAPSKVAATVAAVRAHHQGKHITAILELHTFSSLDKAYIPHYAHTMDGVDKAYVLYNPETAKSKQMELAEPAYIKEAFARDDVEVISRREEVESVLQSIPDQESVLLIMTSGNLCGINVRTRWD